MAYSRSTLVICEGELNAAAIDKVSKGTNLTVRFVENQCLRISEELIEYSKRFDIVIVWFDDEYYVVKAMEKFPGSYGIKSIGSDGKKESAMDLAVSEELSATLIFRRFVAQDEKIIDQDEYINILRELNYSDPASVDMINYLGDAVQKKKKYIKRMTRELFR